MFKVYRLRIKCNPLGDLELADHSEWVRNFDTIEELMEIDPRTLHEDDVLGERGLPGPRMEHRAGRWILIAMDDSKWPAEKDECRGGFVAIDDGHRWLLLAQ